MSRSSLLFYLNAVVFFVLSNVLVSSFALRADLTRDGVNSLSESTEKVFSRIKEPVVMEAYITQNLPGEIQSILQPVLAKLEEMQRISGENISVRIINPDTPELMEEAERKGIRGIPVEEARVDEVSQRMGYFGIYMKSGEKSTVVPLLSGNSIAYDVEYRVLRELRRLFQENNPGRIGFVLADGTLSAYRWRSVQDQNKENLYAFRSLLEQDQGITHDISLKEEVPPETVMLIIAGSPEFSETEKKNFDSFLMRGGKALLMLRSFDFQLDRVNPEMAALGLAQQGGGYAQVNRESLQSVNSWLAPYGMEIRPEVLLEPRLAVRTLDIQGQFAGQIPNPAWALYSADSETLQTSHPMVLHSDQVVLPYFSGISLNKEKQPGVRFTTLAKTSPDAVSRESGPLGLRELQNIPDETLPLSVPVIVSAEGSFRSAFGTETSADAALLVIPTPYMVSDLLVQNELSMQVFQLNHAFLTGAAEVLLGDSDLTAARSGIVSLSMFPYPGPVAEIIFTLFHILFLPAMLAVYGVIRLWKRNSGAGRES